MAFDARTRSAIVLLIIVVTGFAPGRAHAAATGYSPDKDLSASIDQNGTGALVSTVRTPELRSGVPHSTAPKILLIGTGVQRALFPASLQDAITATGDDAIDTHGFGTIAASTILQLIPDAKITSRRVRAADANWHLADLASLASALEYARANAAAFDAVLLAFPPQAALDPITFMIGYGDYGTYGRGMAMVEEALLSTPARNGVAGIPADRALRDKIFARTDLRQRDAVERYARHAIAWRRVLASVRALDAAGVALIAPAGDFTRRSGATLLPLVTQTTYGLSSLDPVITVGAAYNDGSVWRVSPSSGRGPTLALGAKPDLLAPSEVMSMLPANARLQWADDSSRSPLHMLEWARTDVAPSPCPSVTNSYKCVLQGSSMIAAAVATANIASLAAAGVPNSAGAIHDQVLRGIAWAAASRTHARASTGDHLADVWEEGAGVLTGLADFAPGRAPVALQRADFGEVAPGAPATLTIPLWSSGGRVTTATPALTRFLGPDSTGAARPASYNATSRMRGTVSNTAVTVAAAAARPQGGIYAGRLSLGASEIPLTLTQNVTIDFHVDEAYNEFSGGGEGERVEAATMVLFAGLPQNVGIIGDAFKNFASPQFARFGGDPTNSIIIRAGTARDSFTDAAVAAADHGRGQIGSVPPGFYRLHVLTDHAVDAQQARGRAESLGVFLATSGPEAASAPGANLLVTACSSFGTAGPVACALRPDAPKIDPSNGLCVAEDQRAQVAFDVYCGEIAYATPTAIISRAVHLVDFREWSTCGMNVPLDGSALDFSSIAAQAKQCSGQTAPTAWSFKQGAPECVAPSEAAMARPDITATYAGPSAVGAPGRNLPVAVLTYTFDLPYLNTNTTATATLQYAVQNAIVGVHFSTGSNPNSDSSNGVLVADSAGANVTPVIHAAGARGTASQQWSVMSSNAASGTVSFIIIPTAWARADLDPSKPIATAALCDVALRVSTFAKQAWSAPDGDRAQFIPTLDRGLLNQIDPSVHRMRASFDGTAFRDAGTESENLVFAAQVPKNSTYNPAETRHVRSPVGGPAGLRAVRKWGTDAQRHEIVLDAGTRDYDPQRGIATLQCNADDPRDPTSSSVCKGWNAARAANDTLAQLAPELSINGRFDGVLAIDATTIKRAAGNVAFEISDADDGGASGARWSTGVLPVSNYYDDVADPWSLSALAGVLSIAKTGTTYTLTVRTDESGGSAHTITADLG